MMTSEELIQNYVSSIIKRHELPIFERVFAHDFYLHIVCEKLKQPEWHWMGYAEHLLGVMVMVADDLIVKNHIEMASNILSEGVQLFPRAPQIYVKMARTQVSQENNYAAKKSVNKALSICEKLELRMPEKDMVECVDILMRAGHLNAATRLCWETLDLYRTSVDAQNKLKEIERRNEKKILEIEERRKERNDEVERVGESDKKKKRKKAKVAEAVPKVEEPKVKKTVKAQKKEQLAKQKELADNIEKARKAQEEEVNKKREEKKDKVKVDLSDERASQPSLIGYDVATALAASRPKKSAKKTTEVEPMRNAIKARVVSNSRNSTVAGHPSGQNKLPLENISSALDQILSSGSYLRCICRKCSSPRVVTAHTTKCHTCQSNHELWYKKVGQPQWVKPRTPPKDVRGDYVLCKHFLSGRRCIKTPCNFAHSQDDIEIWDICRGKSKRKTRIKGKSFALPITKSASCMNLADTSHSTGRRSRADSSTSASSLRPVRTRHASLSIASFDDASSDVGNSCRVRTQSTSSSHSLQASVRSGVSSRNSFSVDNFDECDSEFISTISLTDENPSSQADSDDWYSVCSFDSASLDTLPSSYLFQNWDSGSLSHQVDSRGSDPVFSTFPSNSRGWGGVTPSQSDTTRGWGSVPSSAQANSYGLASGLSPHQNNSLDRASIHSPLTADVGDRHLVDLPTTMDTITSTPIGLNGEKKDDTDGWKTAGKSKKQTVGQSVPSLPTQMCCGYCKKEISRNARPVVQRKALMCRACNRSGVPFQQYWDGQARKIRRLRPKPSGINNIQLCWHFSNKNDHFKNDCKFAHGAYEKELWEMEMKEVVPKKKKKQKTKAQENTSKNSCDDVVLAICKREMLNCTFCNIMFGSPEELERHKSEPSHMITVMEKLERSEQKPETNTASHIRRPPDGVYMGRYKLCYRFANGYCQLDDNCTFAHGQEELNYWEKIYNDMGERLTSLKQNKLIIESFSQSVRRRIKEEGTRTCVLKDSLPGVTLVCSSEANVYLEKTDKQIWIFDVRIKTKKQGLLKQVAFLSEEHLNKFKLLKSPGEKETTRTMQSVEFHEDIFVEDPVHGEAAVQFCVMFFSPSFGTFAQEMVLDFGGSIFLSQPLTATVVSKDSLEKQNTEAQSVICQISEWSLDNLELVLCPVAQEEFELQTKYNIPHDLPKPGDIEEFTRGNYCNLWHTILFIEELEIHRQVSRYDLLNGQMKTTQTFQTPDQTFYASPGKLFGEIKLQDHLYMDEASGHLIERSVLSVIVRPKIDLSSVKVYECLISLKKAKSIIVDVNPELIKDLRLCHDQTIFIDLKFQYNRLPMAEMHDAIDRCHIKGTSLFFPRMSPNTERRKSIPIWYLEKKPNASQLEAITMILDTKPSPPLLLIGPFGTGKTFTLNMTCVEILRRSEQNRVLICTHSNSAADLHLDLLNSKIIEKAKFERTIRPVRIVALFRKVATIPTYLRKYCLFDEKYEVREPKWSDIQSRNVVITTLAMARVLWKFYDKQQLRFTHILIDEAAQAMEPECMSPLVMADEKSKVVLAGDHMQMGPVTYSEGWLNDLGPKRSLLCRFYTFYKSSSVQRNCSSGDTKEGDSTNPPHVVLLTENYRCHEDILRLSSDLFYGKELVARGDKTAHASMPCLSFYTAQGEDKRREGSLGYYNDAEVEEIAERVEQIVFNWPKNWEESIGVLAPYNDQVKKIRNALKRKGLARINVQTVENVQGQEFRALFISTVRTGWTCWQIESRSQTANPDFAFLSDERLLNTAVTRAKSLLVVVGDPMSLCSIGTCQKLWKEYIKRCADKNAFHGCTLKIVHDFCLSNRALNPDAQEFNPTVSTGAAVEVSTSSSAEETATIATEAARTVEVTSYSGPNPPTTKQVTSRLPNTSQNAPEEQSHVSPVQSTESNDSIKGDAKEETAGAPVVSSEKEFSKESSRETSSQGVEVGGDRLEPPDAPSTTAVESVGDVVDSYETRDNVDGSNSDDELSMNDFFCLDNNEDYDDIISALIEACKETKRKDGELDDVNEEFPPLNTSESFPQVPALWPRPKFHRTFSAGMRNGRIELGFHVKDSEMLFRLTGGHSSTQSEHHYINAFDPEKLLALLRENPQTYSRCTLRTDVGRQRRCYGQVPDPDIPDICIPGRVRGAYDDDIVVVEIMESMELHQDDIAAKTGYVKGVLRTAIDSKERQWVCTVSGGQLGAMLPINKTAPKLLNFTKTDEENIIPIYELGNNGKVTRATALRGKQVNRAKAGELLFVVKLLKWRPDCPVPLGLAVRHLPSGTNFATCMEILYEEHNIKREFREEAITVCKREWKNPENWAIPPSEKARPAYRKNVFTVDPTESMDLDDAISIRCHDNGNYELQIHIADVSYFVRPNTPLDEEAKSRGTSYYPPKPHKNVPMLPRELSEGCCSLLEGKDRLAITLSVELTSEADVVGEPSFERSIVRSCCRLDYSEAQEVVNESRRVNELNVKEGEDKEEVGETNRGQKIIPSEIKQALLLVHQLAVKRRQARLGERSFHHRNDNGDDNAEDVEAHEMIAEMMILANHLTAKFLLTKFPECTPLRVQLPPKTNRIEEWKLRFQKFAKYSLGIKWLGDSHSKEDVDLDIKVPSSTWKRIMAAHQLSTASTSNEELVKAINDVEKFPQLALAYIHQQRLRQRANYTCSNETSLFVFGKATSGAEQEENETVSRGNVVGATLNNPGNVQQEMMKRDAQEDVEVTPQVSVDVSREDVVHDSRENIVGEAENPEGGNPGNVWRGHSSLELDAYCHFTSPIRRYIDVIVHRLLVASSASQNEVPEKSPYTIDDMTNICDRCSYMARNCSRFDKEARKVQLALSLQSSVTFVQAWIDEITSDTVILYFGPTEFDVLKGSDKSIRIARFGSINNPEMGGEVMTLEWKFRLLRVNKEGRAQPKDDDEEVREETEDGEPAKQVDNEQVDFIIPGAKWRGLLEAVKNDDQDLVKKSVEDLNNEVHERSINRNTAELTVIGTVKESPEKETSKNRKRRGDQKIYLPSKSTVESDVEETDMFCRIKKSFQPCDVVEIQFTSQISRGILSPRIQLFKITDKMHVCIEHRTFPTQCFAKPSTKYASRSKYDDIEHYLSLWKPVLMMEIATSAVREGDCITLSNLKVKLSRDPNNKILLEFLVFKSYCKIHYLDVFELNLICVRIKDPSNKEKEAGVWVGHFQVQEQTDIGDEKKNKDDQMYAVKAKLVYSSSPIPEILLEKKCCYVTAELICLSTPDRRRLGALWHVEGTSDLLENICTGVVSKDDLEGCRAPRRDLSLAHVDQSLGFKPLNKYQQQAVHRAVTKPFTLIQGPPGTGKTVTGVHIAYWFAQMNKERNHDQVKPSMVSSGKLSLVDDDDNDDDEEEKVKPCMVFYCGPSNKSVDVVARYLMKIPGLNILRIYGQEIERKEFPIPDRLTAFRSRLVSAQLKADEELRDVSLHHVIRNVNCPFSKKIKDLDTEFRTEYIDKKLDAPRKTIEDYKRLIMEAEEWAMTSTEVQVILCTCTAAYSPRIMLGCFSLCQCIVDECGMCIEAETLCAMLGSHASQVVFIGDHKQLQPIIQCAEAKDLGLDISMFERYYEDSLMLEIQYRMHEEICLFPSIQFYENKLQTADSVRKRVPKDIVLWPKGNKYPFVFYHMEGKEETQVVSTETGNENSKSNKKEVIKVAYVVRTLMNSDVKAEDIVVLSPYCAQCFEIGEELKEHGLRNIAISSVVAAQGSEKDYVILSLVRSLPAKEIEKNPSSSWLKENLGFITDEHQINVALTRSRRGLCIVGNANLVGMCDVWRDLLQHYEKRGCLVSDDPTLIREHTRPQ